MASAIALLLGRAGRWTGKHRGAVKRSKPWIGRNFRFYPQGPAPMSGMAFATGEAGPVALRLGRGSRVIVERR